MDLENLRRSYEVGELANTDLATDPIEQFRTWFASAQACEAPDWFEPNAMTMSSADSDGKVSSRILLLKKITDQGFAFFTNYRSEKARQLEQNPHAALLFFWPPEERQIRIEGTVSRCDPQLSDEYFHERPRGSQISAVVSPQSSALDDRQAILNQSAELDAKYADQQIPRPEYWGGYILKPQRFEFWQGRPNRLHDRFVYTPAETAGTWQIQRLAP